MYLNGMTGDTSSGLCLIKKYEYCTYEQDLTCNDINILTTGVTRYLPMGIYILPKVNTNLNYSINTVDDSIAIVVDSISGFTESYIRDLVTTGYTSYDDSGFENRVIYDSTLDKYFYYENTTNSTNCSIITDPIWAITDYDSGDLYQGVGEYWYVELDDCGEPTGNKWVYLNDINPDSETYGQTQTINFGYPIFFGSTDIIPTTSADITSLPNKLFNHEINRLTLNTGNINRIFVVAIPSNKNINLILDETAMYVDITRLYNSSQILISDINGLETLYNVYVMENAIPYSANHKHKITFI